MTTDKKHRVLVIDDENSNITVLSHILSPIYKVYAAKDGQQGIRAAEKHSPDIILLDVLMPEMDGYEVLQKLKSSAVTARIPVIFLTAQSDEGSELEGLSLGAVDYITKPFSPPLLHKRIELHLLIESQRRELVRFNRDLRSMVESKTRTVVELQNAILRTITELVECRDGITGGQVDKIQRNLGIILDAIEEKGIYAAQVEGWSSALELQSGQRREVGKTAIADSALNEADVLTDDAM